MHINSDINVLGSIADYNLIISYVKAVRHNKSGTDDFQSYSKIKTTRSFERYERAINSTILQFKNAGLEVLFKNVLENEGISPAGLLFIFWNSSCNNEFLHHVNSKVLFPALYSGRIGIKKEEVIACIKELRQKESALREWTDSTIDVTARKYIAFLVKVHLMKGNRDKTFAHVYLDDKTLVLFIYWLLAVESKPNVLGSRWLPYAFMEKDTLIDRLTDKVFRGYFEFQYSGNNLKLDPLVKYEDLYDRLA